MKKDPPKLQKSERDQENVEKTKALDLALLQIEKEFGKGAIMKMGDGQHLPNISVIPTGALPLDVATGVGGIPRGRVIEIFGPESSGKTTLCLSVVNQVQKMKGVAAFIDAEHALDPTYAEKLGVKLDDLLISQPDTGEQALQITEMLIRSNAVDLIVIDSVAALVPRAEIEGDMGDSHMGLQARLMSQALRKLTAIISKSRTCLIFINQMRDKIGVMFGNPETTPGGKALKFYSSMRLDIRKIGVNKHHDQIIGNRIKVKVVKNKVAAPFRIAEFDIFYDEGISRTAALVDVGTEHNLIDKTGTWFTYNNEKIGQGRENARNFLRSNPEMANEIEAKIREKLFESSETETPVETAVK
jgi:recombination protein RecA